MRNISNISNCGKKNSWRNNNTLLMQKRWHVGSIIIEKLELCMLGGGGEHVSREMT